MPYQTLHLDIPQPPDDAHEIATTSTDPALERNNRLLMIYAVLGVSAAIGAAIGLSAL
jgi:hypothetical protein